MSTKAAVVYESMFGNTRRVAEAVAEGLASSGHSVEVTVMPVADAAPDELIDVGLLVVGGPTHLLQMTSRRTREMRALSSATAPRVTAGEPEGLALAAVMGVREWLNALSMAPKGRRAAAFDTRLSYRPAGGAAPLIARALRCRGYRIDAVPRGFLVDSVQGPLKDGESERARAWGASLGQLPVCGSLA
jgi:hypothetical protein